MKICLAPTKLSVLIVAEIHNERPEHQTLTFSADICEGS